MRKITPCLWFDTQAEEAARFYTGIFKNSQITRVDRYGPDAPMPAGTVLLVSFELDGEPFMALNGGPVFTFTPAISFYVNCETQAEVDALWVQLAAGGEEEMCGWVKDKYGVSWQIVPAILGKLMADEDPAKVYRVTQAMLQMRKLDIAGLLAAAEGS